LEFPVNVAVLPEQIAVLAPHCVAAYGAAFAAGQGVFDAYGVSHAPLRVAHFLAQVLHESGALRLQFEQLHYTPERLMQVWPRRFLPLGPLDPADYAFDAEKLANAVYGGRMGNTCPGDGYRFRGRGLLQLTGKDSYARATTIVRLLWPAAPDFTAEPDAVCSAAWSLHVAASEWAARGCNRAADLDDLEQITRSINGGLIGLPQRRAWSLRTKRVFMPD
jgi:putative chitinase